MGDNVSRRDLNYFERYEHRGENHLTRATLSLMRLVPGAHGEFLRLVSPTFALTALPERVEFDFQTSRPHPELEARIEDGDVPAGETSGIKVVSVYITPDEVERPIDVVEASRRAIYDGVIRYGDELVVLIEAKLEEGIDAAQAQNVNLGGLSGHCELCSRGAHVRWHELFEAWVRLDEREMLAPAERMLLSDFFDTAEHEGRFAGLLPFTNLRRTGGNRRRRDRRLKSLLQSATGRDVEFDWAWFAWDEGAWTTFSRMYLWGSKSDAIHLAIWPGEQQREARALYQNPARAQRFVALDGQRIGHASWQVSPNVGINVRVPRSRMDFTCALPVGEYVDIWSESLARIHQYRAEELEELFSWMTARGLADDSSDRQEFTEKFVAPARKQVNPRAGVEVVATWQWDEAVELDDSRALVDEIRQAVQLLETLDSQDSD